MLLYAGSLLPNDRLHKTIYTLIALVVSIASLLWGLGNTVYSQLSPDIRSTASVKNTKNFKTILPNSNMERFELEFQIGYRNHSFKPGYIDKVEFIPDSRITIKPLFLYADKTLLMHNMDTTVKIITIFEVEKTGVGMPITSSFRLYDNAGRVVTNEKDNTIHTIDFTLTPVTAANPSVERDCAKARGLSLLR